MKKEEVEYWSSVREMNPKKYIHWFKDRFPKQYADWYARFYSENVGSINEYQRERRGSGHSGQSSVNNDPLSVKEKYVFTCCDETVKCSRVIRLCFLFHRLLGINDQPMFRPVQSDANDVTEELRCSPSKFSIPHVKGNRVTIIVVHISSRRIVSN